MMHTNGGDQWFIVDSRTGEEIPYRSQFKAKEDFKEKSSTEPGRYSLKHFSEATMTTSEVGEQ